MVWSRTSLPRYPVFKSLFVIARNSSFTYKGKAVDVKQVGVNSVCVMSLKEACARPADGCGLPGS